MPRQTPSCILLQLGDVGVALRLDLGLGFALGEAVGARDRHRRVVIVHSFDGGILRSQLCRRVLCKRDGSKQADRGSCQYDNAHIGFSLLFPIALTQLNYEMFRLLPN